MKNTPAPSSTLAAAREFHTVRRNRIFLGAAACLASTGLAVACISTTPPNPSSASNSAPRGGPVVIAHCSDGSDATFELDRAGSTQIITGRFMTQGASETPLRLSAEFRRAGSDDDSTIALEDLAGSVIAPRKASQAGAPKAALPTTHAYALKSLVFEGIQESVGGHISLQWGRSQMQLSGCHFNVAVLERMRGQEHLPFVIARAK